MLNRPIWNAVQTTLFYTAGHLCTRLRAMWGNIGNFFNFNPTEHFFLSLKSAWKTGLKYPIKVSHFEICWTVWRSVLVHYCKKLMGVVVFAKVQGCSISDEVRIEELKIFSKSQNDYAQIKVMQFWILWDWNKYDQSFFICWIRP